MRKKVGKLNVITDTKIQNKYSHEELAGLAIKGGADMIQFRDKNMQTGELIETALRIKKLCDKKNVLFIVNDRVDAALVSGADGVHLGKEDIPIKDARKLLGRDKVIGVTARSLKEALSLEKDGADYIGLGHIFPTGSKLKTTQPIGLRNLQRICKRVRIPVIAIGGINTSNAREVVKQGAWGIAVIGSVTGASNPPKAVRELRQIIYG